jgi:two-component system sensor histidine kinase UhpB
MLGRLRAPPLAEFGLADAIGNMVEFWRRRNPEIRYRVDIAPECDGLGEFTDITIYRVVQECLSNAVRHGKPANIGISVRLSGDDAEGGNGVVIEVTDDGRGMRDPDAGGFGLLGMKERVAESGGHLTLTDNPGGGVVVMATLPRPARHLPAAVSLSTSAS